MRTYTAFYRNNKITVQAESSYSAQLKAAAIFRVKKSWDVSVVLADVPLDAASFG